MNLIFANVSIKREEVYLKMGEDAQIISALYRGRFENNGILSEHSQLGQGYFYIEFEDGRKIELLAERACLFKIEF